MSRLSRRQTGLQQLGFVGKFGDLEIKIENSGTGLLPWSHSDTYMVDNVYNVLFTPENTLMGGQQNRKLR